MMKTEKTILDACCGSRMFWFDKHNHLALFVDNRSETVTAKDRDKVRTIEVKPDIIADFTNLPFEDNSFYMVVFDPPHLKTLGLEQHNENIISNLCPNFMASSEVVS